MIYKSVSLENYRNYEKREFTFHDKVNFFLGENGRGKTNLLESIYLTSYGKSFRTFKDRELIRFGEDYCRVKGTFIRGDHNSSDHGIAENREGIDQSASVNELDDDIQTVEIYIGRDGTRKGNVDGIDKMFMADSIATVCGACLGTSTTTTYVESSAGVGAGGRTGLTAFAAAACFALALFFSPVFLAIPGAATAPALIIVGMMMMNPVREIDWTNYRESIPAFLTVILMPLAYSISDGILIGVISYVVLYALTGKAKQITPTMWVLAVLFILRYIFI